MDIQVPEFAPYTHYQQRVLEKATAQEISGWLAWAGGMAMPTAEASVRCSDELVVCRDARGAIQGAHGLSFLDVANPPTRVVTTVFSVFDRNASGGPQQLSEVAQRIFDRERSRSKTRLVWVAGGSDGSPRWFRRTSSV